jgi:hypothetical protein
MKRIFIFFSRLLLEKDFNENVFRGLIKSSENIIVDINKKFTLQIVDKINSFFS